MCFLVIQSEMKARSRPYVLNGILIVEFGSETACKDDTTDSDTSTRHSNIRVYMNLTSPFPTNAANENIRSWNKVSLIEG